MYQTYNNYRVQGCALGKIFREHFGLPSILAGMPRPKRWSPKYNLRGTLRAPKHFSWGARASNYEEGGIKMVDIENLSVFPGLNEYLVTTQARGKTTLNTS